MSYASDLPFFLFLFLLAIQTLLSVESLRGGLRFRNYLKARLRASDEPFEGFVTVVLPCKGAEPGLARNIEAVLSQKRGEFEVVFVVEDKDDPAVPIITQATNSSANLVVAGGAKECGQKVHNLQKGVMAARDDSVAYVFVDSDARPGDDWLSDLLAPLNRDEVACSSGYRWFVQDKGGFATHFRAAWNASIASALGPDPDSNFCWGGSTAISRVEFEKLGIAEAWKGTLSDDFVLTNVARSAGRGIHFEPKCLSPTVGDCGFAELLEFTTRQMKITRTYSPKHFAISLAGSFLFVVTFFTGLLALPFLTGWKLVATGALLITCWALGSIKSIVRVRAAADCMPGHYPAVQRQLLPQIALWPLSSVLFLYNDLRALASRTITWRGIEYELVSDQEIRIKRK